MASPLAPFPTRCFARAGPCSSHRLGRAARRGSWQARTWPAPGAPWRDGQSSTWRRSPVARVCRSQAASSPAWRRSAAAARGHIACDASREASARGAATDAPASHGSTRPWVTCPARGDLDERNQQARAATRGMPRHGAALSFLFFLCFCWHCWFVLFNVADCCFMFFSLFSSLLPLLVSHFFSDLDLAYSFFPLCCTDSRDMGQ